MTGHYRLGVITPSNAGPGEFPRRWARACAAAEAAGFELVLARHCAGSYEGPAAPAADVVTDWVDLVESHSVDAVIASTGGHGSNRLLNHVPWHRLQQAGRPIVGYSDVTALLWAAYGRSLPAIHGPMILSEFGHVGGPMASAVASLTVALAGGSQVWDPPGAFTTDDPRWDLEDDRPLEFQPAPPWRTLRHGATTAPVLAGCLPTISLLFGTPWMPDTAGHFVLLEDPDLSPGEFASLLQQWQHTGRLQRVSGLGFGRRKGRFPADAYDEIVLGAVGQLDIPVLADLDFGHTEPKHAIALGSLFEVDTGTRRLVLHPPRSPGA